uniref:Carboxylesterase n=1 Tax=Opuntia streptacantha TaxID=393608 RepID=A0A7C8ZZ25_OPUST
MDEAIKAKMEEFMASIAAINSDDLLHDFRPFLVVYKDGRLRRLLGTEDPLPAGSDGLTGVESKDVVVSPETGVFFRLYKPPNLNPNQKVPLLIYIHGGGFCIESAKSPLYHHHLNSLSSKANVIIASVDYRLAPEFPLPTAYDDVWSAIEFVAAASASDPWLKEHADYSKVFFAGDSAGANIAHHMAKRIANQPLPNFTLNGVVLINPYFWGEERIGSERLKEQSGAGMAARLWKFVCPGTNGADDPLINPAKDPELAKLGGSKVLVLVAEKDALRDRGVLYKETLEKSGWKGAVEVVETAEEDHVFHLMKPSSANAAELMNRLVAFFNHQ